MSQPGDVLVQILVKTTFKLLTASYEPFTPSNLCQALWDHKGLKPGPFLQISEQLMTVIENVCGSMIVLHPRGTVAFIHEAVPQFPILSPAMWSSDKDTIPKFRINPQTAHKTLAICCLRVLQEAIYTDRTGKISVQSDCPGMLSHAGRHWVDHVSRSGSATQDTVLAVTRFLVGEQSICWIRRHLRRYLQARGDLTMTVDQLLTLEYKLKSWAARFTNDPPLYAATNNLVKTLFERYLADLKSQLSPRNSELVRAFHEFGNILACKGDYSRASSVMQQNLAMVEDVYGTESLKTMRGLWHLAQVHMRQGKWEEADASIRIAIQREKTVLGPNHPDTLSSMSSLAEILVSDRDGTLDGIATQILAEAEDILLPTLEMSCEWLGKKHPLSTSGALVKAKFLAAQRDDPSAVDAYLHHQALAEKIYGQESRTVLSSMNELGTVHQAMGGLDQAEAKFGYVYNAQRQNSGPKHPDILDTLWQQGLLRQE